MVKCFLLIWTKNLLDALPLWVFGKVIEPLFANAMNRHK